MAIKKFFTTGEVANLLNISRSTVSRKFDRWILLGKKNPITGERLISRESIVAFMKRYRLPFDALDSGKKIVLLGTSNGQHFSLFQRIFSRDERVQIERVKFGADVLVGCSRKHPDLLVIDEEVPYIPCAKIIKALRRMDEQKGLKILCLSKRGETKRCLKWGADGALAKGALEGEIAKKVYSLLGIPGDRRLEAQTFEHKRRWPRMAVHLPAKIEVYCLSTPHHREPGEAVVENISCGGAYLSGIQLEKGTIPGEPFRFLLKINAPP